MEPYIKNFEVKFVIDGVERGSADIMVIDGKISTSNVEDEFFAVLRKNEKMFIESAEEDELVELLESNNDFFEEKAMEDYHGSKDGWESYYDNWCSDLTLSEAQALLATQPSSPLPENAKGE